MRRRLLNMLTVLSAFVSIASLILGIDSFNATDKLVRHTLDPQTSIYRQAGIVIVNGRIIFGSMRWNTTADMRLPHQPGWEIIRDPDGFKRPGDSPPSWRLCAFGTSSSGTYTGVNLLLVIVVTSILPTQWLYGVLLRRWRIRHGCCVCCGYDLRATRDRCPECGHFLEPQSHAAEMPR